MRFVLPAILSAVMIAGGIYSTYLFMVRPRPERAPPRAPETAETAGRRFAFAILPRVARAVQERPVCVLGE